MLRTLLIDDEALVRADLREKLAAHPEVRVVGEAATVRSARTLLVTLEYELVFFDVQLIGGESFQLLPDVRPGARFIFVSGHALYAARALESQALDFLLKPVETARLAEAVGRAQTGHAAPFGPGSVSPFAAGAGRTG